MISRLLGPPPGFALQITQRLQAGTFLRQNLLSISTPGNKKRSLDVGHVGGLGIIIGLFGGFFIDLRGGINLTF